MAREVVAPGGVTWTVRRRWASRRVRLRSDDGWDLPSVDLADGDDVFAVLFLAVAVVLFLALVVFPLVALLVELLLLLVVFLAALFGRVVLRRPWELEARNEHGGHRTWHVAG